MQRIAIALISIPSTVVLAVVLFSFNALWPESYASLLRFADWVWQGSLNALSAAGDTVPGARALTNAARQGFSGHHFVIMAYAQERVSWSSDSSHHMRPRPTTTPMGIEPAQQEGFSWRRGTWPEPSGAAADLGPPLATPTLGSSTEPRYERAGTPARRCLPASRCAALPYA